MWRALRSIGHVFGLNKSQEQLDQEKTFRDSAAKQQAMVSPTLLSYQNLLGQVQAAYRPSQGMLNAMMGGQNIYRGTPQQGAPALPGQTPQQAFREHADLYYNPSLADQGKHPPPMFAPPNPAENLMQGGYMASGRYGAPPQPPRGPYDPLTLKAKS